MKNKKFVLYPVIAAVLGLTLAGILNMTGVLAYLTNNKDRTNQLTRGYNEVKITETFPDPAIAPGRNSYTKDVTVKNTGPVPCYVRVFLDFSDDDIRKNSKVSSNGSTYVTLDALKTTNIPSGWAYVSSPSDKLNSYFYYTSPIDPGASTTSLIKAVQTTFGDQYDIDDFDIYVYTESIQSLDKNGQPFTGATPWRSAWEEYLG